MLIIILLVCLGIGFLIKFALNKIPDQDSKKEIIITQNLETLNTIKTKIDTLKLPYIINLLWDNEKRKTLDWPLSQWNVPLSISYLTEEELISYKIIDRIIPLYEDYMIYAYDIKTDSFLEFHLEDTKLYDDYPKQNWQQFLTNHFYNWYWNSYMDEKDEEDLTNIKNAVKLLDYKHFSELVSILESNSLSKMEIVDNAVENLKKTL
jgi:hypothetical protein